MLFALVGLCSEQLKIDFMVGKYSLPDGLLGIVDSTMWELLSAHGHIFLLSLYHYGHTTLMKIKFVGNAL